MESQATDVDGCRDAHRHLATVARQLSDLDVREQSLLPGWTVGHVPSHLARNAEAMVRRIEGAQRCEVVEQYVGGGAGRAAEIERGASRSAAELFADVVTSSTQLEDVFASLDAEDWARSVRMVAGGEHPVSDLPFRRWREVEIHLVDLSDNYDFLAARAGLQPFNSDFRGFIFNDINLGARVFGTAFNNRFQYNVAAFDLREKDTNSELNTFDDRDRKSVV